MLVKNNFYDDVKDILQTARDSAYRQVNFTMVEAYWNIGKQIVEEEQNGKDRAEYGKYLIKELSSKLTSDFGKGVSPRNMRQFYMTFQKWQTVSAKLTWSHYILLLRLKKQETREYYLTEAIESNWSVKALERQIGSHYYERIVSSRDKCLVKDEAEQNTKSMPLTPKDIIKDPYNSQILQYR